MRGFSQGKWRRVKTPTKREVARGNAFLAPSPMKGEATAAEKVHQKPQDDDEHEDRHDRGADWWIDR